MKNAVVMTFRYLTTVLLMTVWSGLYWANDINGSVNGTLRPPVVAMTNENDALNGISPLADSLPAISKNGKDVAFIASRSEYNDSAWQELRIVSLDGHRKSVLLEKSGSMPPAQSTRQAKAKRKAEKRSRDLLNAGKFRPLVEFRFPNGSEPDASVYEIENKPMQVGNWLLTYKAASRELCILDREDKRVFARQAAMKKPFYCCEYADNGDKCTVGYTNVRAWGNDRVVFILGEYWGYPDGCEIDYHYWVIWPAEGKAFLETNE
jgi:hypothetical protein